MSQWTFEEFIIAELALVGLWAILHFAINWINSKAVIDDGRL